MTKTAMCVEESLNSYLGKGLSDREISKLTGVSPYYVKLWREKNGVTSLRWKKGLTKESCEMSYAKHSGSIKDVAEDLGVCVSSARRALKRFGIDTGSRFNIHKGTLVNKYGTFEKNVVESRLKNGKLTVAELGVSYGLKEYQMVHVLRLLGIDFRNSLCDTRVRGSKITVSMHQLLLGTLMGDASMKSNCIGSASYHLGHSINQMDYAFHIAGKLKQYLATIKLRDTKCQTGIKKTVELWTHAHSKLYPYYSSFYSNGKKCFDYDFISSMTAEGLAYWYMDDGMYKKYRCILCVGKVGETTLGVFEKLLRVNFGIDARRECRDKAKGYWDIVLSKSSKVRFLSLIRPYIIASMGYKLGFGSPTKVQDIGERFRSLHGLL